MFLPAWLSRITWPEVSAIALARAGDGWLALATTASGPIAVGHLILVRAARDVHRFDRLRTRRLGRSVVYEAHDPTADDTHAAALRDALRRGEDETRAWKRLRASGDEKDATLRDAYRLALSEEETARAAARLAEPTPLLPAVRLLARGGGVDPSTLPALD